MINHRIKPMTEGGVLSAVSVVMALISIYVPVLGAFVALVWPLPIVILIVRHGMRWGVLALAVSAMLIAILAQPQALLIVASFGLVGLALGHNIRTGYGALKTLLLTMAASIVSKVALFGLTALVFQINPAAMQLDVMRDAFAASMEFYRSLGLPEQEIAAMEDNLKRGLETIGIVFPALFVIAGMMDAYINFAVSRKVLKRLGVADMPELTPFRRWRLPWSVVYIYAFSWVGLYWGSSREIAALTQVSMNANMLAAVLGFVQGLCVLSCAAARYQLSKLVRGIILLIILTNGFLLETIGLIGLFDIIFDYRRRLALEK